MGQADKNHPVRRRLAYDAARLMTEELVPDEERARRKAAGRAGVRDKRLWPSAAEVREALQTQQRLFRPEQGEHLRQLREQALTAMQNLRVFNPRLVGPVLDGSADQGARIRLHLFADDPVQVAHALLQMRIPWTDRECTQVFPGGQRSTFPSLRFFAGESEIELVVMPPALCRHPPLNPITERPDRGADADAVAELLAEIGDYRFEIGT